MDAQRLPGRARQLTLIGSLRAVADQACGQGPEREELEAVIVEHLGDERLDHLQAISRQRRGPGMDDGHQRLRRRCCRSETVSEGSSEVLGRCWRVVGTEPVPVHVGPFERQHCDARVIEVGACRIEARVIAEAELGEHLQRRRAAVAAGGAESLDVGSAVGQRIDGPAQQLSLGIGIEILPPLVDPTVHRDLVACVQQLGDAVGMVDAVPTLNEEGRRDAVPVQEIEDGGITHPKARLVDIRGRSGPPTDVGGEAHVVEAEAHRDGHIQYVIASVRYERRSRMNASGSGGPGPPVGVNHVAYQTMDVEATHRFYTEVLRCRFAGAIRSDGATLTSGERSPAFLHVFYETERGDCLAFFALEGDWERRDDGLPVFTRHLALGVHDADELAEWRQRLVDHGVTVSEPVDHDGIWTSIYFFDPNGVRLELTHQRRALGDADAARAQAALEDWLASATTSS